MNSTLRTRENIPKRKLVHAGRYRHIPIKKFRREWLCSSLNQKIIHGPRRFVAFRSKGQAAWTNTTTTTTERLSYNPRGNVLYTSREATNGMVTRGNVSGTWPRRRCTNNKKVEGKCRRKDEKLRGRRKNAPLDDFTLRIETPNPAHVHYPPKVSWERLCLSFCWQRRRRVSNLLICLIFVSGINWSQIFVSIRTNERMGWKFQEIRICVYKILWKIIRSTLLQRNFFKLFKFKL